MGDTTDTKCCARVLGGGADFLSHHVRSKQKFSCAECWCIHVPGLSGMSCTANIDVLLGVIVLVHNGIHSDWSGCATSTEIIRATFSETTDTKMLCERLPRNKRHIGCMSICSI